MSGTNPAAATLAPAHSGPTCLGPSCRHAEHGVGVVGLGDDEHSACEAREYWLRDRMSDLARQLHAAREERDQALRELARLQSAISVRGQS